MIKTYFKFSTPLHAISLLYTLLLIPSLTQAQTNTSLNTKDMLSFGLEQLLDIEVLSGAKKLQALSKSASAIFVITADDILRSGKTTIPELLRMVPGMEVASFNSHTWAVSMRGFNSLYANKLLVLLDGRNVYSWEFSGTRWHTVDTLLEDIDRIEIIRGPGGTLWGANAVNGVINIISKNSSDTKGWLASAGAGSHEEGFVHLRYGGEFDEYGHNTYRVYVKRHDRDSYPNAPHDNSWRQETAGMRMDGRTPSNYHWRFSSDFTRDYLEDSLWGTRQATSIESKSFNVLGRISSEQDAQSWHLQMYFQTAEQQKNVLPSKTDSFDIEWQHRFSPYENHDLVWGLNARRMNNELKNGNGFSFKELNRQIYLLSGFVQDEFTLSPDRWVLTLGAKMEHYENAGTAFLPNVRLLWTPDDLNSVWLGVSRAVRPASRFEQETRYEVQVNPKQVVVFSPNSDFASEYLTAYELGWRQKATPRFNWEAVTFIHDYTDLVAYDRSFYEKEGVFYLENYPTNNANDQIYGTELSFTWQPDTPYLMQFAYTWLNTSDETSTMMRHQASLRAGWQANPDFRMDLWLRYNDKLCNFASPVILRGKCIDAYNTLDLRLAWQLSKQLELSFNGSNLLDSQHLEFESEGSDYLVSEVPRQFYLQLLWQE